MNIEFTHLHINVDTVKFSVDGVVMSTTGATICTETNKYGEVVSSETSPQLLFGRDSRHALYYSYQPAKKRLTIEGALAGFLFGQNVFSTWKLKLTCWEVLMLARRRLKFDVSQETARDWSRGEGIHLERVDLAVNFGLNSNTQVEQVLGQVARQLSTRASMRKSRSTVYWEPNDGKEYTIGMIDLGSEVSRIYGAPCTLDFKPLSQLSDEEKTRRDGYDKLPAHCRHILRMLVRVNAPGLQKHELDVAANWQDDSCTSLVQRYVGNLPLMNAVDRDVDSFAFETILPRHRHIMALYLTHAPIDQIFSKRTRQRHVKMFLEQGYDITACAPCIDSMPLGDFFGRCRPMLPPAWLHQMGLRPAWCLSPADDPFAITTLDDNLEHRA